MKKTAIVILSAVLLVVGLFAGCNGTDTGNLTDTRQELSDVMTDMQQMMTDVSDFFTNPADNMSAEPSANNTMTNITQ